MVGDAIFWPMGALALITFTVLGHIPIRRFAAVKCGAVSVDDFRLGESERVDGHVSMPNRAMMNLLEVPMLFYIICLMALVSGLATHAMLVLAWGYVALRLSHTLIHMTYNRVMHRVIPFAASNLVLIVMWIVFFVQFAMR